MPLFRTSRCMDLDHSMSEAEPMSMTARPLTLWSNIIYKECHIITADSFVERDQRAFRIRVPELGDRCRCQKLRKKVPNTRLTVTQASECKWCGSIESHIAPTGPCLTNSHGLPSSGNRKPSENLLQTSRHDIHTPWQLTDSKSTAEILRQWRSTQSTLIDFVRTCESGKYALHLLCRLVAATTGWSRWFEWTLCRCD